ncbi:protein grindelwald [Coccinella septempunctata]|uniref:protein grindelwald n=1 Tax=Coccinella septempunctata TaxID=41139 RepID=UPI001D097DA8|nr:protein grindelwald [Coccinella septempunctata]
MLCQVPFVFLFIFMSKLWTSNCAITIDGVQCGQRKCDLGDYCSVHDGTCKPCVSICAQDHHNFEEMECNRNCQDYLHNLRYSQKNGTGVSGSEIEKLKEQVRTLSYMITTTLVLVCFMLFVLVVAVSFQLYRWKVKKNISLKNLKSKLFKKSEAPAELQMEDPSNNKKPDLRLDITNMSSVSDHSPVTAMTSVNTRRPAEDTALDYAYDNHAMTSSSR